MMDEHNEQNPQDGGLQAFFQQHAETKRDFRFSISARWVVRHLRPGSTQK